MPKFNVHSDYFDHPKVQRLKVYCGEEADIFPIRLWGFCAKHFPATGILKDYTESEIERVLNWKGIPGNLIRALISLQFLDKKKDFYGVHDWKHHAGFINAYKLNALEMNKKKWGKHRQSNRVSSRQSIRNSTPNESNLKEKNIKTKDNNKDTTAFASVEPRISTPPTTTPQADFVTRFKSLYEKMTGQPFNDTPRHYKLAHDLIQKHGVEAVVLKAKTLAALCSDGGRVWFTSGGWADFSIEKLSARWNDIIPEVIPLTPEEKQKIRQDAVREEVKASYERTKRALDS